MSQIYRGRPARTKTQHAWKFGTEKQKKEKDRETRSGAGTDITESLPGAGGTTMQHAAPTSSPITFIFSL